jgi:hypothetical protein
MIMPEAFLSKMLKPEELMVKALIFKAFEP